MRINLQDFAPGNKALSYLEKRILDVNYRGDISSQHNRWTFDDLLFILQKMQKFGGDKILLKIRTTDKSKRPKNTSDEFDFAMFCEEVVEELGKGSQDAMRKNYFPDWHRAGWLNRFDKDKNLVLPYEKSQISYVNISEEGQKLLSKITSRTDKYFIFSKGLDIMYSGIIGVMIDLFRNYNIQYIDLQEFTFFVTGISSNGTFKISRDEAAKLINSWRLLTSMQRKEIDNYLSRTLVPKSNAKDKTYQRDYHNWINKTQQTFFLLKQTIYFELVEHIQFSHFNRIYYLGSEINTDLEFNRSSSKRLNRSLQQKHDYFSSHTVEKKRGFELHHIVALAWAESQHDFKMLDDWRNMIYIDGYSHAQITQNRNLNTKLIHVPPQDFELVDYNNNKIHIKYLQNGIYDIKNIPIMLKYNNELRK